MARTRLSKLDPEVRHRILEAARHEFAKHGLDQASLNAIIEQAGISKGVLYYYFEDKQDLYLAIIQEARETMTDVFGKLAAGEPSGDYWADMRTLARQRAHILVGDPEMAQLLQDLYRQAQKPGEDNPFRAYFEAEQEFAAKFLQTGQTLGKIRTDLSLETIFELSFAVSDVLERHFLRGREVVTEADLDRYADTVVDVLSKLETPRRPVSQD